MKPAHSEEVITVRICGTCNQEKHIEDFYYRRDRDNYRSDCKQCHNYKSRSWELSNVDRKNSNLSKWRRLNPESTHSSMRKQMLKKYGLTPEDYKVMYEHQTGRCNICAKFPEPSKKGPSRKGSLFVDHDHITGEVRGLLCGKCNAGLGFFYDNPRMLERALEYLEGKR